ncbi:2338_t:CDS:2, partial [Gigaspora rosea]
SLHNGNDQMKRDLEIIVVQYLDYNWYRKLLLGTTKEGSLVFDELEDSFVGLAVGRV